MVTIYLPLESGLSEGRYNVSVFSVLIFSLFFQAHENDKDNKTFCDVTGSQAAYYSAGLWVQRLFYLAFPEVFLNKKKNKNQKMAKQS
jgi:hypothetical protein